MNTEQYLFADKAPYPDIKVSRPNQEYAVEMLENIGSSGSEMTAICRYLYNNMITKAPYEEISICFHRIMVVEMHHLEIFGELALQLGADPRLWCRGNRCLSYWSPDYVTYSRCLGELLENSRKSEEGAVAQYRKQKDKIKDNCVVENLERIILDELHHIDIFSDLLHRYTCRE